MFKSSVYLLPAKAPSQPDKPHLEANDADERIVVVLLLPLPSNGTRHRRAAAAVALDAAGTARGPDDAKLFENVA